MYILRTIINSKKKGEFIMDNWYTFHFRKQLIEKVNKIDPEKFECYHASDITKSVISEMEEMEKIESEKKKRALWEELNKEFKDEV